MPKVGLQLPEETLRLAQRSAEAAHSSLERWIAGAIERTTAPPDRDPVLGLFSDIPELMNGVVEDAMASREQGRLRTSHG